MEPTTDTTAPAVDPADASAPAPVDELELPPPSAAPITPAPAVSAPPKTTKQKTPPGISEPGYVEPSAPAEDSADVVGQRHAARLATLVDKIDAVLPHNQQLAEVRSLLTTPLDTPSEVDALRQRLHTIDNALPMERRWIVKEIITILRELGVTA